MTTVQREESQKIGIDHNAIMTEKEDSAVLADIATPTSDAVDIEDAAEGSGTAVAPRDRPRVNWSRLLVFGILPALVLGLAVAAGFLKFQESSSGADEMARIGSVQAAKDSTTALLSYTPDSVEQQLGAAKDLLTGNFRDSYTSLTHDVVIPGAKQKQISAEASVPAVASVSAEPHHAVVLVFVNQRLVVGTGAPTDTASSVRVTLAKIGNRWLISYFQPV